MMMLVPGEKGGDDLAVLAEVEDEAWQHDLAVEDGGGPEAVLHAGGRRAGTTRPAPPPPARSRYT